MKYGNTKTFGFDSKAEFMRSLILKSEAEKGFIANLECQHKFLICEKTARMKRCKRRYYIADFYYFDMRKGAWIIEDVKSPITKKNPVYSLKKQLVLVNYPDKVFREVEYKRNGFEVVDYEV